MNRRTLLKLLIPGTALLSGCSSSLSEPSEPGSMTGERYPSYKETVTLDADEDFWVLEMPGDYPSEAVYRYNIENVAPDQGAFDILFFDFGNYTEYKEKEEPTWYTKLSAEGVTGSVEKSSKLQGYNSGIIGNSLYLVIDNTAYAGTDPIESGTLQANVEAEIYPNGIGPKPDVGEISFERVPGSVDDHTLFDDPDWTLRVDLAQGIKQGTLKIANCSGYSPVACRPGNADNLTLRRSLSDTSGVENFEFYTDNTLHFDDNRYLFFVDNDETVLAETLLEIDRSIEIVDPQFEPIPGGNTTGKSGLSFRIRNTSSVPIWLRNFHLSGDVRRHPYESIVPDEGRYILQNEGYIPHSLMERYQLGPGQAERFGTPLMNLPKIDQVEQVCNGEPRTAKLRVTTASEYEVEYELTYALDEPAKQIESDQDDLYVCESGEIQSFERIDTDSA